MEHDIYLELLKYYDENYKNLIFMEEQKLENNIMCKLFTYDYSKEYQNFSDTFNYYLPFYIENYDSIINYDVNNEFLLNKSISLWNKSVTRKSPLNSGIFGELMLDFYNRIYCKNDIFIGYALKKEYENKEEFKGIDCTGCRIDETGNFELILEEAKFVSTLYNARTKLIDDINGVNGHLNDRVINEYNEIALKKVSNSSLERGEEVRICLNKINRKIVREEKNIITAMNELGYTFRFVYFAIYKSSKKDPNKIKEDYNKIIKEFNKTIKQTSIINYKIEIIFIPSNNKSVDIKKKMVEVYG